MKKYLFLLINYTAVLVFCTACANIVMPTGGQKDVTPPKVKKSVPENYQVNTKPKKITIEFDEFINLTNVEGQLIVTPSLDQNPDVKLKNRKIEIIFKSDLKENTTYTVNFGNSISDFTENNIAKDYRFVFSTGSYIDSLQVNGSIADSKTGKELKDILLLLYEPGNDSIEFKGKPLYYGRTGETGVVKITNIKHGTYKVIALEDKNNSRNYDSKDEQIGFIPTEIHLDSNMNIGKIYLFKEVPDLLRILDKKYTDHKALLVFNKPATDVKYKVIFPENFNDSVISEINKTLDTAFFYLPENTDSIKIEVRSDVKSDTVLIRRDKTKKAQLNSTFNLSSNLRNGGIKPGEQLSISTEFPIKKISYSDSIIFMEDSVKLNTDSILSHSMNANYITLNYTLQPEKKYELYIPENTIREITDRKHNPLKLRFSESNIENFGSVDMKLEGQKDQQYIMQLTGPGEQLISEEIFISSLKNKYTLLNPGLYKIKIIKDSNKNGKWDTGNYQKKLQAEMIYYYPSEINMRANWDMELEYKFDQ
jgi:uncharacterized protein (DUF2141 family)/methionine-rich copper-binding protein CopC